MTSQRKKVHFMGIGGSGMSAVAMIAKSQGYEVSGCDLQESTPYLEKLKAADIPLFVGHDAKHVDGADILAVTAAAYYQNAEHPEIKAGKKVMQWQEFLGSYLQKDKRVVCVAGTHGKSTTTSLLGLVYEAAGKDPTVEVGATVKEWHANYRLGKGKEFINEADEFYENFLFYTPDVIILNNIEFDHPDFFDSYEKVQETFLKFVKKLKQTGVLILNQDSQGVQELVENIDQKTKEKIQMVGYTLGAPRFELEDSFVATIKAKDETGSTFEVHNKKRGYQDLFKLAVPGDYNIENAMGIIALAVHDNVNSAAVKDTFLSFSGTGRRMDLVASSDRIFIYDDYAHHPTEIKVTLSALRQKHPKNRIICVAEPHMFSRTKKLLQDYKDTFKDADVVRIAPIYRSRDTDDLGMTSNAIVEVANHPNIKSFNTNEEVIDDVTAFSKKGDVIIVMGAGDSYKITQALVKELT